MWDGEPTPAMLEGLRNIEDLKGIEILDAWRTYGGKGEWAYHCRLWPLQDGERIGDSTDWYVCASRAYPAGSVSFYPAVDGGLRHTFPHQTYNEVLDWDVPWCTGNICLSTPARTIARQSLDIEPMIASKRLRWNAERALEWVSRATTGTLVSDGDPFELPHSSLFQSKGTLAFNEDSESFECWKQSTERFGQAVAIVLDPDEPILVIDAFHKNKGEVIVSHVWGERIDGGRSDSQIGAWIRLESLPTVGDWRFPATWGELRGILDQEGQGKDQILQSALQDLRDDASHFLLIGFPIPDKVGHEPSRYHWLGMRLPRLASGSKFQHGFRKSDRGYFMYDLYHGLAANERLFYMKSANWNTEQIKTRGRLDEVACEYPISLIGAGAIGSSISELLVRAGCNRLMIVDNDSLEIGNLARHTLTLDDLNADKAPKLAERLNKLSPDARIQSRSAKVSSDCDSWIDPLEKCRVIVDCTGDDNALVALGNQVFANAKVFISVSIGFGAKRLFLFSATGTSFPSMEFWDELRPWLDIEREEMEGVALPWEGIGCYHPVFPARSDDIWLWASVAVKKLEQILLEPPLNPTLWVFECDKDDLSVRQVALTEVGDAEIEPSDIH